MKHTITTEYEISDVPADLALVCEWYDLTLELRRVWDGDCWRLRLYCDYTDFDWEGTFGEEFEMYPDYEIASNPDYDGGYNWDGLCADDEDSHVLMTAYVAAQKKLYPNLKFTVDWGTE